LASPIFLFAAQPQEFFLDGIETLKEWSHNCVGAQGRICKYIFQSRSWFFYKAKYLSAPLVLGYALDDRRLGVQFLVGVGDLSIVRNVQTSSECPPSLQYNGTGSYFFAGKAAGVWS
jgi:hypothetical protein